VITAIPHTLSTHGWWLAGRASGLVALVLVTISVAIGLTMAGKPARVPGLQARLLAVHQQTALAGLVAIAVHGASTLLDPWLRPGLSGVAVPFVLGFHPFWTGLGIVAGYLAFLLGLSFYLRKRIGAQLWRRAHRATVAVYLLGLFHALGAGNDTSSPLFAVWAVGSAVPISLLFVYRLGATRRLERRRRGAARQRRRQGVPAQYEQPLISR
jgi:methionine sulfoxide reductase heme-binding subunit